MAISDLNRNELKSNSNHLNTKEVSTIVDTVQERHLAGPIHKYRLTNFLYKPPFGLPRNINIPLIRDISRSIYVYSIINRIIDEIVTTKWDISPKEGVEMTKELETKRRAMIEFFKNPNSMNIGFEDFVRQILLDTIVLDSGVIVKVFNMFGEMVEMKAIDGGTITKNPDIYNTFNERSDLILDQFNTSFEIPQNRDMTEQEKIKLNGIQTQFKTIYNDTAAYFQYSNFSNASAPIAFGKRELVYLQKNPSPGGVYSYGSPVQASVDTAMSLIFGGKYNLDYFLNGNTPEGIIKVAGADEDTLNSVKEKLQNKMQITDNNFGISRRIGHNLPAVSSDNVEFIPINFTSKDLEIITQAKWFIRLLWQMFGLSPDEMGDTETSNRSTGDTQTRNALRKGYTPYMNLLEYNFTRNILTEFENGDLFEFKFDDSDPDAFKQKLDIAEQELRMGIKTPEMIAEEFDIDVEILKKSQDEQHEKDMEKLGNEQEVNNNSPENNGDSKNNSNQNNAKPNNKEEVKSNELKSIVRSGNKFVVLDKSEKQVIGTYDTLEEAQAQAAGIEINNSDEETKGCEEVELKEAIESEEKVDKLSLSQVLKVIKAYVKDDEKAELDELIELKHKYTKRTGSAGNYQYEYDGAKKKEPKISENRIEENHVIITKEGNEVKFTGIEYVEGKKATNEEIVIVKESINKFDYKLIGDPKYLNNRLNNSNAFVVPGDKDKNIYICADDGFSKNRFEGYIDFVRSEKYGEKFKEEIESLNHNDWKRKTILHENGHLMVFEKFGFVGGASLESQDSKMIPYLDLAVEHSGNNERVHLNEVMAEDLRIINAKRHNDNTQHILSSKTYNFDMEEKNNKDYEKRLKLLEGVFF